MKKKLISLLIFSLIDLTHQASGLNLPAALNLGISNILDGGPKVEKPGFDWEQYQLYYHAHTFADACGNLIGGIESPRINSVAIFTELLWQSKFRIFKGAAGGSVVLPPIVFSGVSRNSLGISDAGAGLSNPLLLFFLQWDMIKRNERPLFIHRLGVTIILPIGTNKFPKYAASPADIMTCIDPYWAASLFFTEKLALSWRLMYLWCAKNKKTNIQPGQTFHMNFSAEYEFFNKCWLALNGYYLQQLKNSTMCGMEIPNSKERIVAAGPGILWDLPRNYQLLAHLYFEFKAKNRPQGIKPLLTFIKHF